MTTIIADGLDPAKKELAIPFQGDRDLGDHELRRLTAIGDFKGARLGGSLYPEGFITDGLAPIVAQVTNLLPYSEDFTQWDQANGLTVEPNAGADRYGDLTATRLRAIAGFDGTASFTLPGAAVGRKVFAIDLKNNGTSNVKLTVSDNLGVRATLEVLAPSGDWTRTVLTVDNTWGVGATDLTVTIHPAFAALPGTLFVALAQVEDVPTGEPLVAGAYVKTTGAAASGAGSRVAVSGGSAYVAGLPRPFAASTLDFDPMKREGVDVVYAEVAERYLFGAYELELRHPITGEAGNDSVREETQLTMADTTSTVPEVDPINTNPQYRSRHAAALLQLDRATGTISRVVQENHIDVGATRGDMPGRRILPQSIPEDRLDLKATEGQPGLLAAQARRMVNAAGDFVVTRDASPPTISQDLSDTSQVKLKIEPLDGYTTGKSHYLEAPQFIATPLQSTTADRRNENHTFYTGTNTYALAKAPVVSITELVGIFQVVQVVTRGAVPGGKDELANSPVFEVLSVVQGATTFAVGPTGSCFQNGDQIDWSPNGVGATEPVAGSSYTVTYLYSRVWPAGEFTFNSTGITFIGANRPVNALPFEVEYAYGQDRVDLVTLGRDGLEVQQGTPSDHPTPPSLPQGALALWEVIVGYGALPVTFKPRFTVRVSMAEIAAMQIKIADLTYNVAQLATNAGLRDRNTSLKGILTDPMIDERSFDLTNALFSGVGALTPARIDADATQLKMARTTTTRLLTVNAPGTTWMRKGVASEWASLPFTEAVPTGLDQSKYSDSISVNPFNNAGLIPALITLTTQSWRRFVPTCGHRYHHGYYAQTTSFTVTGGPFLAGENVQVTADNQVIDTFVCPPGGQVEKTYTRDVTETTIIKLVGVVSGQVASAVVSQIQVFTAVDPVGQTFFPTDGDLTGIDVWFDAKDATAPVTLTLRITANGFPTASYIAQATLLPPQASLTGPTRFTFAKPVRVSSAEQYAVVVASNSSAWKVRFAKLGKANAGPAGGFIANQPYGAGVMFASSDGRVWTPYQDQDLAFRVYMAKYETGVERIMTFEPEVFAGGISAFMAETDASVLSSAATLVWEYTADAGSNWHAFRLEDEISLTASTTTLQLRVRGKTTDAAASPIVNAQNVQLFGYKDALASTYVTNQTTLLQNTSAAKAYVTANLKAGTSAVPQLSNDGGATWRVGTLAGTRGITQDVIEYEYTFTFLAPDNRFRGRINLQATNAAEQPVVEEASFLIQ